MKSGREGISIKHRLFQVIFGSALLFILITAVYTQYQLSTHLDKVYDSRYVGYMDGVAKSFGSFGTEKEATLSQLESLLATNREGIVLDSMVSDEIKVAQENGRLPYYGVMTQSGMTYGKKNLVLSQNTFAALKSGRMVVISQNGHNVNTGEMLFAKRMSQSGNLVACYVIQKSYLSRLIASNIDVDTNVYVFDSSRQLIHTNDHEVIHNYSHNQVEGLYKKLQQHKVISTVSTNAMGVMRDREGTLYKSSVPDLGWQIILKVKRTEYLDALTQTSGMTFVFAMLTLMACYMLSRHFAEKLSAPIIGLKEAFEAAAMGDMDVRAEFEAGSCEMSIAGDGFNYLMQKFKHLHSQDPLTGLSNYRQFLESTRELIERFEEVLKDNSSLELGLMVFGIDGFKQINDTYGFEVGDELLKYTATHAATLCANCYEVSRLGGDEFACLFIAENPVEKADQYVKDLNRILRRGITHKHKKIYYSVSAGFCHWDKISGTAEEMIKSAYISLNRGKAKTKGELTVIGDDERQEFIEKVEISMLLRDALDNGEFRLVAQPIRDVAEGCTKSMEFLMRWRSEKIGDVSPAKFIPISEENGMIVPLGKWLLRESVRQVKKSYEETGEWMCASVNISAIHLATPEFSSDLEAILGAYGVPASSIIIEVTERVLMDDSFGMKHLLDELRQMGCRISLDDFGTGYSSLGYLSKYDLDILKIDKSFVSAMEEDKNTANLVGSIIQIASSFGMQVVAEGVETQSQLNLLRTLGCRYVQGYHISRPMEHEIWTDYIKNEHVTMRDTKALKVI